MDSAFSDSITIVGYFALFAGVGMVFVFVNLLVGRFLRPHDPHEEKLEIYECGEPAIGSSFVQFDLRFYVVALIFIVFDVEVAFLFPWATVFGKSQHLIQSAQVATEEGGLHQQRLLQEMGVTDPAATTSDVLAGSQALFGLAVVEVLVFFLILLVAFAYVWRMGALDWVRALSEERRAVSSRPPDSAAEAKMDSALSA